MRLDGDLVFATVPRWLGHAEVLLADGTLDLAGVPRADSAGIALLLEFRRRAQARGRPLQLVNPGPQVRALADFFGVAPLLGM